MVWCLATLDNGETIEYGIPLDEPISSVIRDTRHFATIEILSVEYA